TPGPITVTGGGNPVILLQSRGIGSSVNIESDYSLGAGAGGQIDLRVLRDVTFNSSGCSCIQLADNTTLSSGGSAVRFIAPFLNLGANSSVVTSGGAISVLSSTNAAAPLTVTLAAGSQATFSTSGGTINFMPTSGVGNFGNGNALATTFAADQTLTFAGGGA